MAPEAEGSSPFTHPNFISGLHIRPRQETDEAPVAQLDRVADFESVGRRFESYRARQNKETFFFILGLFCRPKGPLAQLAEQMTLNH